MKNVPASVRHLYMNGIQLMRQADALKRRGDDESAEAVYLQAADFEIMAIRKLPQNSEFNKVRDAMYLSAASLSWCGKNYEQVKELALECLSGTPEVHIIEQLESIINIIPSS